MDEILTYEDRVGIALLKLKFGDKFIISEKVKPENAEMFKSAVKSYIDRDFGKNEGFEIQFTSDYSSVIKLEYT